MSVSGELRSVRVTMDDTGTPMLEFQAASLRFTNLDGAVMDCTASAGDGRISMDLDAKGEFAFRDAMDPVSIGAFLTSEAYSLVEVNAAGTGMLIDPDGTFIPGKTASAGGTYYVSESYSAEDLSLELDFHGTVLGIVPGGMTVAALNGFTLDPSSFSGFTLVDGAVVLDESILRAHGGVLRAESNGDPYTLTLDGKAHDAAYGDTVRLSVSSHAMAVFDADGRSYGSIEDGMWTYVYGHHGDLTLTSVDGKDVIAIADGVRTVGSDAIRFTAPSSFGYLGFELSSGVIAEFSSEDLGPGSKASFCAIPGGYEGYRSFSIYCNGPATVCFPVQSEGTALFHIVKGQSVAVPAVYEQRDGGLYLVAYLDSYSLYYLNEDYHPDEKEDGGFPTYLVLAGVAVAAVAIAAAVLVLRKRSS
jgi:hypothetical protein